MGLREAAYRATPGWHFVQVVPVSLNAVAPSWPWALVALVFAMAWSSMASPTLFAVVGDALPKERRALGFTMQAILRRVPIQALATALGAADYRLFLALMIPNTIFYFAWDTLVLTVVD